MHVCFQYKLGKVKNRLAFYYGSYSHTGGDEYYSVEVARKKAMATIEEAIEIFKSVIFFSSILQWGIKCHVIWDKKNLP